MILKALNWDNIYSVTEAKHVQVTYRETTNNKIICPRKCPQTKVFKGTLPLLIAHAT